MGNFGGLALRGFQTFLYFVAFCCAAIILGFYSYFLAVQADRSASIPTWEKAVEGISGAVVLYTILACILTCCIGGITFFAFLGIVLDLLFSAGFVALAVLTRDGSHSCSGDSVRSPLGTGPADQGAGGFDNNNVTYQFSNGAACRFNKACFSVAIVGAFIFFIAAVFQLFLGRHHKREKRFGPSPTNGYTSGTAGHRRFWQRKPKTTYTKDAEAGTFGTGGVGGAGLMTDHHVDTRPSHETAYTGSTVGNPATFSGSKYDSTAPMVAGAGAPTALGAGHHTPGHPTAGPPRGGLPGAGPHGYHTQPTGTAVNPYGYDNNTRTAATNY